MVKRPIFRCWLIVVIGVCGGAARAGDGLVALQTADPSCADDSANRYANCGNGTVTDNRTGLVWLANADCFGQLDWFEAMAVVAGLSDLADGDACGGMTPDDCDCGLSDGSSAGEWRLPSIAEWEAMTQYAADVLGCSPTIPSDAAIDCWDQQCVDVGACSFCGVQSSWYWSSSTFLPTPAWAWMVNLSSGNLPSGVKAADGYVWPVRSGQ